MGEGWGWRSAPCGGYTTWRTKPKSRLHRHFEHYEPSSSVNNGPLFVQPGRHYEMFLLSRGCQRLPAIISCYKSHSDETAVARLDVSPVMKPINQLSLTLDLIRSVVKKKRERAREAVACTHPGPANPHWRKHLAHSRPGRHNEEIKDAPTALRYNRAPGPVGMNLVSDLQRGGGSVMNTHPAHFHQVRHHDDGGRVLLPDHPPEVKHRLLHWT